MSEDDAAEEVENPEELGPDPVSVSSSAAAVRRHCEDLQAKDSDHKPMRNVDKKTGSLELLASSDLLLQWVPQFDHGLCATWCRIPIFRIRLFRNTEVFQQGGLERCYVEQVFPEGEDLVTAVIWWRKRIREEGKGFAVFEGGFDTSGLVHLTDPPRCCIDAETGEVQADEVAELDHKRELHNKRRGMDARWAKKGVSAELRAKIEGAEGMVQERKRRGEEYALRGGWVPAPVASASGAEVAASEALDVSRHNNYQKWSGCK